MKWYWKMLIIVSILILIWGIYENLTTLRDNDQLNNAIKSIRTRNAELVRQLKDAQIRVVEIEGELTEVKRTSERLGDSLRGSQKELAGLRKQFGNLRAENQQLTAILNRSTNSAAGIRAESENIERSLDRAISIVKELRELYSANGN